MSGSWPIPRLGARRPSSACGAAVLLPQRGLWEKTFAEQVPGLTTRYGRRSAGLAEVLRAIAMALGGRAGARLAGRLGAHVSRMTLIRLIRALPDPVVAAAPKVLGVDEFALRRGHSYGTVLIDVQAPSAGGHLGRAVR